MHLSAKCIVYPDAEVHLVSDADLMWETLESDKSDACLHV